MKAKYVSAVLALACALYLLLIGYQAIVLIDSGELVAFLLGVGLLVLPVIGGWVVVRELRFGRRSEVLAKALVRDGALPIDDLPRLPSGRVDADAADARFVDVKQQVESQPGDWRRWYLLAIAYDDARDRRRARAAMRQAIRLFDTTS